MLLYRMVSAWIVLIFFHIPPKSCSPGTGPQGADWILVTLRCFIICCQDELLILHFLMEKKINKKVDFLPLLNVFESKLTLTRPEILLMLQLMFRNSGFHNHLKYGKLFLNKKTGDAFHINWYSPYIWNILLMEEILHQLKLVVYPIIYRVLYIPRGWEWDFFHQSYQQLSGLKGLSFRASHTDNGSIGPALSVGCFQK